MKEVVLWGLSFYEVAVFICLLLIVICLFRLVVDAYDGQVNMFFNHNQSNQQKAEAQNSLDDIVAELSGINNELSEIKNRLDKKTDMPFPD